ncbi:MAG: hypothetical protein U9R54_01960, partial [Bacteroidota bacterium]|nr:hypothetical protein [Bacteroidota bacterium]
FAKKTKKINPVNHQYTNQRNLIKLSKSNNLNKPNSPNQNIIPDDPSEIKAGMTVKHSRFGAGKVTEITGDNPNIKAVVNFQNIGEKTLLLKFAKLQILN